jgi:hypothetical protein
MGITRVILGCAKAGPVGRGHEHPHDKKNLRRCGTGKIFPGQSPCLLAVAMLRPAT